LCNGGVGDADFEGVLGGECGRGLGAFFGEEEPQELLALELIFGEEGEGFRVRAAGAVTIAHQVYFADCEDGEDKVYEGRSECEDEGGNRGG
jgi:hypothetical protein